jgi:hypothetical protein
MALKSSYELALEKAGGREKPLTDEQKAAIAKLRADYTAKKRELRFTQEAALAEETPRIEREDDQEGLARMKADFAGKRAALEAEEEAAVEKLKAE